jgi:hypothetical protein
MANLLLLLVLALLAASVVVVVQLYAARRRERDRVTYRVVFPRGLKAAQVAAFWTAFSGRAAGRDVVVLEAVGTPRGIEHHLTVARASVEAVTGLMRALLGGVRFDAMPETDTPPLVVARELYLTSAVVPLAADDAATTSAAILAALVPSGRRHDERVVVQVVVTPSRSQPRLVLAPGQQRTWDQRLVDLAFGRRFTSPVEGRIEARKFRAPVLAVAVRLAAATEPTRRPDQLLARPLAAIRSTQAPGVRWRARWWLPVRHVAARVSARRIPTVAWPSFLNAEELAAVCAWPLGTPLIPGLATGAAPQLAPASDLPTNGLVFGTSNLPNRERPVAIGLHDATRHIYIPGPTGTGKSTLALNLVLQQIAAGHGCCVIDPKGDLVGDLLDRIPSAHAGRVIVVDPSDDYPVGLNLLDGPAHEQDLLADHVTGLLARRFARFWGARTDDICRAAVLTLVTDRTNTLADLPVLLTNPAFRRRLVGKLTDPTLQQFWTTFESWSETEQSHNVAPLLNKTRAVLLRRPVRGIIGQPSRVSFDGILRDRNVLLVNLAAGLIGEDAAALLGGLIFSRLWAAAQRRAALPVAARVPFYCTLDEFQTLTGIPTPLADVLALARAYGFGLTLLNQHLSQLPPDVRQAVLANCRTKATFSLPAADAAVMAKEFAPYLSAAALQALGRYELALSANVAGRQLPPATAMTLPMPEPTGQADVIRLTSRQRYGRARADVEAILRARHQPEADHGPIGRRTA